MADCMAGMDGEVILKVPDPPLHWISALSTYEALPIGTLVKEPVQLHGPPGLQPLEAHSAVCDSRRSETINGNRPAFAFVIFVELIGSDPPTIIFTG